MLCPLLSLPTTISTTPLVTSTRVITSDFFIKGEKHQHVTGLAATCRNFHQLRKTSPSTCGPGLAFLEPRPTGGRAVTGGACCGGGRRLGHSRNVGFNRASGESKA